MTRRRLIRLLLYCAVFCAALAALAPHLPGQGMAALACHPAPILLCRILHAAGFGGGMPSGDSLPEYVFSIIMEEIFRQGGYYAE